ncbi:hypothetical protein DL96DRAFT_1706232 [Flagelloscypha sp. PMI_526]|nr:hypothetical protein DL96DRAFT_1706232 [Flagelloscypha sp. PMI_526]
MPSRGEKPSRFNPLFCLQLPQCLQHRTFLLFPSVENVFRDNTSLSYGGTLSCLDVVPEQLWLLQMWAKHKTRSSFISDDALNALVPAAKKHASKLSKTYLSLEANLEPEKWKDISKRWKVARTRAERLLLSVNALAEKPTAQVPSLPADIVWRVCLFSAQAGGLTQSRTLSLVSKDVSSWVNPILFSTIHSGSKHETLYRFFDAFRKSPRLQHAGPSVTTLVTGNKTSHDRPEFYDDILSYVPSFTALAYNQCSDATTLPKRLLNQVKCFHWLPPDSHSGFHSFFQHLTHLSIEFSESISSSAITSFHWSCIALMPNIRVLAVDTHSRKDLGAFGTARIVQWMQANISKLVGAFNLELVLWHHTIEDQFRTVFTDPRLVLCNSWDGTVENWEELWPVLKLGKNRPVFWSLDMVDNGLRLVQARRKRDESRNWRYHEAHVLSDLQHTTVVNPF